jgi:hypothetical protein
MSRTRAAIDAKERFGVLAEGPSIRPFAGNALHSE